MKSARRMNRRRAQKMGTPLDDAAAGTPAGYRACCAQMALAAARWVEERGTEGLAFTLPADDGERMFIAPLVEDAIEMMGANELTREFLRNMDAATGGEATAFLACHVIRAMDLPVTDWTEQFWVELLKRGDAMLMKRGAKPGLA